MSDVEVLVTEATVVEVSTAQPGPQGSSGVVSVTAPVTNTGTSTAAVLGLDQSALSISPTQVSGTAVVTSDSRLSNTRTPTDGSVTDAKITSGGISPSSITGTAVTTGDPRLSDARTPTAHADSHGAAGSDPLAITPSQVTGTAVITTDSRLSDARVPTDGSVTNAKIVAGGISQASVSGLVASLGLKAELTASQTFTGQQTLTPSAITQTPLMVTSLTGQTNDIAQFVGTSGTLQITSGGGFRVNTSAGHSFGSGTTPSTIMTVGTYSPGNIGLIVKGVASQSANLQEWRNSAGTPLVTLSSGGTFTVSGLVVRGATGQVANFQEFWDSTGTALLARVTAVGGLIGSVINTTYNYAGLREENAGGTIQITRQTTQAASPGAGMAKLYFRDGTTAGTLKLVVRAGAAGAETTILDNIPQ